MYLYRADLLVAAVLCTLDGRKDLSCMAQKKRRER